jgi:putative spermidine/putrescine transport system permease protein
MMRYLPAAGRVLIVVWFLLPLVPIALWAISNQWSFPAVLPSQFGLDGLRSALAAGGAQAFLRSTGLSLAVAALATPLGAVAARALVRGDVHLPGVVAAILLAPLALPPFAVVMGLDVLILRTQIPSTIAVVALLTVVAIPYTTYLMRTAFGAYDFGYEEEARTLGASTSTIMRRIRIPMLAPALTGAALLAFLVGWSDYVITLLIGGGRLVTLPILVASFAAGTRNDAVVAALSIAAVIPPLVLVVLLARLRRRSSR